MSHQKLRLQSAATGACWVLAAPFVAVVVVVAVL
jgi:hypothetical protein